MFRTLDAVRPRSVAAPALPVALVLLLAVLPAAGAAPAEAQVNDRQEGLEFEDTGPLRIREQFALSQPFLSLDPSSALVLERGHWQVDLVVSGTNNWAQSDEVERFLEARESRQPLALAELRGIEAEDPGEGLFHADGELYRTSLAVRYGLGAGFQLGVTVPVLDFQGGFGDRWIEEFHDAFGFSQSGRLGVPRDDYRIYLRDRDGNELFRSAEPGTGLGDVSVALKKRLELPGTPWLFAVEGVASLPTGEEEDLYGSGNEDFGVQALATRYYERSCIHAGLGAVRVGESDVLHTDSQTLVSGFLGYERAFGRTWSVVIQGSASQSPFKDSDIALLDEVAYLIDLGVKKGLNRETVLVFAITENLVNIDSSADFGVHLGVTWTR